MKSLKYFISLIIILIIIGLIVFIRPVFDNAYNDIKMFLVGLTGNSFDYNQYNELVRENEQLKFKINNLEKKSITKSNEERIVEVYSMYPFNDKEHLILNIGENDGIKIGLPVLTENDFLIGKIVSINGRQSDVQTIFDSDWKTSVGIGDVNNKALIKGGQPPKLELLLKTSVIKENDYVFSVSPDFPYKTLIGKVKSVKKVKNQIWDSALVDIPYDLNQISKVKILINFP